MKEKVIKFRAWCESIKKLCNVRAIDFENEKVHIEIKNDFGCYAIGVKSDEVILEQYTGLKDKNGKEIYEGDVIKHYKENYIDRYEVYFDDIIAQYRIKSLSGMGQSDFCSFDYIVIGNIHENEDLLG